MAHLLVTALHHSAAQHIPMWLIHMVPLPISSKKSSTGTRTCLSCSLVCSAWLFLGRKAFCGGIYFDISSEIKLCCQVPLPHKHLEKNKGTEQRANVFEVTGPRAQLLTLQQWVMLWFSYVLLGAKWNNTGSAVGLGIKHCTSRSAPSREHNWCLPCTWFLARTVCGVACLLSITKEEKSGSWPDLLASSSASPQLLFPMCACMYTGETWTQIKTKAETNHSVILSTVIPIRLSKLKHNYMYIFCSIWDNFISKPFLLLSVLAVQSSKILSHWKWSEERMHFLTWIPLADDAIRLLSAQ